MANLRVAEDIVPLSQFKAKAADLLRRISETGAPIVITQPGRAAGVLLEYLTQSQRKLGWYNQGNYI